MEMIFPEREGIMIYWDALLDDIDSNDKYSSWYCHLSVSNHL